MVLLTVIMAGAEPLIEEGSLPHRSNVKLEMKDKMVQKQKNTLVLHLKHTCLYYQLGTNFLKELT